MGPERVHDREGAERLLGHREPGRRLPVSDPCGSLDDGPPREDDRREERDDHQREHGELRAEDEEKGAEGHCGACVRDEGHRLPVGQAFNAFDVSGEMGQQITGAVSAE